MSTSGLYMWPPMYTYALPPHMSTLSIHILIPHTYTGKEKANKTTTEVNL